MAFSTERTDQLWWLMAGADANAARVVLAALEHGAWHEDLPRLVRGALARQRGGAWDTTTATAWGVLAVERFAAAFEQAPVTGTTTASLAAAPPETIDWGALPAGRVVPLPWPPAAADVVLVHAGGGSPWATIETRAALPLAAPVAAGVTVRRTVMPLEAREPGRTSRGDVLRVRLEVETQRDMTWVVVSDPLPAGASHVVGGLAAPADGDVARPPVFVERAFDAFRAYWDWVPEGALSVEYVVRLNAVGRFGLPPTRVEALYAPEMFGEAPNAPVEVAP
jgi:uncharacterized protein YfaS (alpha-2-macroglobulin family)